MLYRVTKRADDTTGLIATLFWGAASVSVVCGGTWGHFKRTGILSGEFVTGPAAMAWDRTDLDFHEDHEETPEDIAFINGLRGKAWRPWHNCFGVLEGLWQSKKSAAS